MMESENYYANYVKETGKDPEAFILRKLAADEWSYAPDGSSLKEDAAIVMMKPFSWWAGRFDDKEVIELLRKIPYAWNQFINSTPHMAIFEEDER